MLLSQNASPNSSDLTFTENIIDGYIEGDYIKNCFFSKNIIANQLSDFQQGNQFINNIFLYSNSGNVTVSVFTNTVFRNNIFLNISNPFFGNSSNNTFYNNLFTANLADFLLPGTSSGNLYWVSQSSIFINQSGNTYDYHQNYHLKSSCLGHNYGTDGTDLGVYGTATPWKDGGVPYNPHIQFQSIATQTDGNGNLSVNIKVAAQKN